MIEVEMSRILSGQREKGIALVEVILALGVSIIVITSLVSLSLYTLRASLQSKLLLQATNLSKEELERIRAYRDLAAVWTTNFLTPLTPCATSNCYIDDSLVLHTSQSDVKNPSTPLQLTRYFRISDPIDGTINGNENLIRVSVTVNWKVGTQDKNVFIYSDFSNWRGR